MNVKENIIILVHAFVGWTLCAATMGIGMTFTSEGNALIIHAIAAPAIFAVLSFVYFQKFNYTTPLQTATIFVAFVIAVDLFVVAFLMLNSFEMFASLLGTWIPFFYFLGDLSDGEVYAETCLIGLAKKLRFCL